jgi:hypothetical protein
MTRNLGCEQGIEYNCPYREECDSKAGVISSINPHNPHRIYSFSKNWTNTTKTWMEDGSLYVCQPQNSRRERNIEIMHRETFYEKDTKQIREKVMEEMLETISELKKLKIGRS